MPLYISLEFDEEKMFEWEYNSALYPWLEFDFFLHRRNVALQKRTKFQHFKVPLRLRNYFH